MYRLDKIGYFLRVLKGDPGELLRVARIAWTTAKFRYLKRCVGVGSVIGAISVTHKKPIELLQVKE